MVNCPLCNIKADIIIDQLTRKCICMNAKCNIETFFSNEANLITKSQSKSKEVQEN